MSGIQEAATPEPKQFASENKIGNRIWLKDGRSGYLEADENGLIITFEINNPTNIPYSNISVVKIKTGQIKIDSSAGQYKFKFFDALMFQGGPMGAGYAIQNNLKNIRMKIGTESFSRQLLNMLKLHNVKVHNSIFLTGKKAYLGIFTIIELLILSLDLSVLTDPSQSTHDSLPAVVTIAVISSIIYFIYIVWTIKSTEKEPREII
jgi:hypothetical protein